MRPYLIYRAAVRRSASGSGDLLLFSLVELLDVDGLLHLLASSHRRLDEGLTCTQGAHRTRLLKLSLEASQSSFDVFALFYWNYDHNSFSLSCCYSLFLRGQSTLLLVRKFTKTLPNKQIAGSARAHAVLPFCWDRRGKGAS